MKAVDERYWEDEDHNITENTRSGIGIPERCEIDTVACSTLVPDPTDWLALKNGNNDTGRCVPDDEGHDCEGRISKLLVREDSKIQEEYRRLGRGYRDFVDYLADPKELDFSVNLTRACERYRVLDVP